MKIYMVKDIAMAVNPFRDEAPESSEVMALAHEIRCHGIRLWPHFGSYGLSKSGVEAYARKKYERDEKWVRAAFLNRALKAGVDR